MMHVSQAIGSGRPSRPGVVATAPRPAQAGSAARRQIVNFADAAVRHAIEQPIRDALGVGCRLDLTVDEDILPFVGDPVLLGNIFAGVALDMKNATGGCGALQLCALNVFDRCGGDRDQVLIVLNHAAQRVGPDARDRFARAPQPAAMVWRKPGSSLWRALRFAAEFNADCELIGDDRVGMALSFLHPVEPVRQG